MLASQGWHLLQNPESLVARVIKSRYYCDTSFLDAALGDNPSYTWRSIHAGIQLIRQGCTLSIGAGEGIKVWQDLWIKSLNDFCPLSNPLPGLENLRVADLMIPDSATWNEEMILGIFTPDETEAILQIALSRNQDVDGWQRTHTQDGQYSVKSGYRCLQQVETAQYSVVWAKLWNLNIPPKIKHFVWRLCEECLPT